MQYKAQYKSRVYFSLLTFTVFERLRDEQLIIKRDKTRLTFFFTFSNGKTTPSEIKMSQFTYHDCIPK